VGIVSQRATVFDASNDTLESIKGDGISFTPSAAISRRPFAYRQQRFKLSGIGKPHVGSDWWLLPRW
jgi:hypothetical protein